MEIQPASNRKLKEWKKLLMSKYRRKEGLFIAEGIRCVEQILETGSVEVKELLIEQGTRFDERLKTAGKPIYELESDDFQSVSDTDNPQGVVAVCKTPVPADIGELAQSDGLIAVTDAIQDPGNLGTIIRTASWFGVSGLIFGTGTVDPFHPKVVRSTAGATGALPYATGDLEQIFRDLEEKERKIYLLAGEGGAKPLGQIKPDKKSVLVVGNEANGISRSLMTPGREAVKIEGGSKNVESLNAGVALSIGLYRFSEI